MIHALPEQNADRQPVGGEGRHFRRRKGRAVGKGNACGKAGLHLFCQRGVDDDGVGLGDMAPGRKDVVGKAAVVRQQDETGAGLVQPPGREQLPPGIGIPHQIHDRRVPLVGGGADDSLGLVEHKVDELPVGQRLPSTATASASFSWVSPFLQTAPLTVTRPFASSAFASLRVHWAVSAKYLSSLMKTPSVCRKEAVACGNSLFSCKITFRRSDLRVVPQHPGWRQRWA